MSHRAIEKKQIARLRKSMRGDLPATIDLVMWLKDRGHASTSKEARQMLADGRVRAGSHPVGRFKVGEKWEASPAVPSSLRSELIFV